MIHNQFLSLLQIRELEQKYQKLNLVDIAGESIAKWVNSNFDINNKILIVIGSGNNGCDGVVAAILLKQLGYTITIVKALKSTNKLGQKLLLQFKKLRGQILVNLPLELNKYDVIIDGIFGIGIIDKLNPSVVKLIQRINLSNAMKVSLDTPSGLNPFTGEIIGSAIKAHYTLTFLSDKPGFYTGKAIDNVGKIIVFPLVGELKVNKIENDALPVLLNSLENINYQQLKRTIQDTNKSSFGTIAIVGGCNGMVGALYLAGRAALLNGAGKVVLVSPDSDLNVNLVIPELMHSSTKNFLKNLDLYDVIVIGPGLGCDDKASKFLTKIIKLRPTCKLIFDADALNLLAMNPELLAQFKHLTNKAITPHPGEASRLLNVETLKIQNNRFLALTNLANKLNAYTLLKGAGSLLLGNNQVYINTTGNSALSTAGSGDTLCGIIAAFAAQGMHLFDALRFAVYIHGKSAEKLVIDKKGYNGILASDIADATAVILNSLLYFDFELAC